MQFFYFMRAIQLWLAILGLFASVLFCHSIRADIMKGEPAPAWELTSTEGKLIRFPQATDGRPAIVIFWASWCPYCKALLPKLSEIKAAFESEGLDIYAINFAEAEDFRLHKSMSAFPFQYFLNGDKVAKQYGVEILPAFFIVSDNRIEYVRDYPSKSHPSQKVKSHNKQAPLLADWWKHRLMFTLEEIYRDRESPARGN